MASPVTSLNLSVLSFALSSWLDGSAQLRRSLILFPLELGNVDRGGEPSSSAHGDGDLPEDSEPIRLVDRCLQWLTKPAKDLGDVEKTILGALDVSSSALLLKLLGSGPILPFIMNPLSITLSLPRKLSIDSVKWSRVILLCFLLSVLHEAQRTSVSAGLAWLRLKKQAARNDANVGEVILRGERLTRYNSDTEEEEEEPCVICSGGPSDATLSDSISSLTSLSAPSASTTPDPGPLEAFCVHAPSKHPMHRSCFLAWKDAYWEARASRPIITLVSDDETVPLPGTWQWRRAQYILATLGARIWHISYFVPLASAQLSVSTGISGVGESVFTLHSADNGERGSAESEELGSMVSVWPPCPGCRSAVKLVFSRSTKSVQRPRLGSARRGGNMLGQLLRVWLRSWNQLVTGRTILVKTATQVLFAAFLVSMMRMRQSRARSMLLSRRVSL